MIISSTVPMLRMKIVIFYPAQLMNFNAVMVHVLNRTYVVTPRTTVSTALMKSTVEKSYVATGDH